MEQIIKQRNIIHKANKALGRTNTYGVKVEEVNIQGNYFHKVKYPDGVEMLIKRK